MFFDRTKIYAPAVLRIGIALVFLWFGFTQLGNPEPWTQLIPESVTSMTGLEATTLVLFNGAFEVVFGLCLLFGFFTHISALLLAFHMLSITFTVGYNAIGVRDFGLSMAAIALFLLGPHHFSVDNWLCTKYPPKDMQIS
jgi:uncharacterized membrane protein YphA (DoxX/SURF4 family)